MSTPAVEVRAFKVTIPAGTKQNAPVTIGIAMPPRVVTGVIWRVPPGPSGLMGWQLSMSGGTAVIPTGGGYIITDNDSATWPLTGQPDGGSWEVTGYNTDIYDHSVYLQFLLTLVTDTSSQPQLIDQAALSPVTTLTTPGLTTPGSFTTPAITTPPGLTVPAITTPPQITTAAGA